MSHIRFPDEFLWGGAIAANQAEGYRIGRVKRGRVVERPMERGAAATTGLGGTVIGRNLRRQGSHGMDSAA